MPFKLKQDRRRHIPRARRRVTNWPAHEVSLRQRGSLTDEAIEGRQAKPRTTRGGQFWHAPLAIRTAGQAFRVGLDFLSKGQLAIEGLVVKKTAGLLLEAANDARGSR